MKLILFVTLFLYSYLFGLSQYSLPYSSIDTSIIHPKIFDSNLFTKTSNYQYIKPKTVMPFFCDLEKRIEQSSKIPFRFRVGSLDYVNYLERKKYQQSY